MLGDTLDYVLLRTLAHDRHRATEQELNESAGQISLAQFEEEARKLRKVIGRFEGHFPVDERLSYLDMGCGQGQISIALAKNGVRQITGVDFLQRSVDRAASYARLCGVTDRVKFVCQNLHDWKPEQRYDVLLSFDVFEHIEDPRAFLVKMQDFLAPGGVAILAFGPLFHSPFGDHMGEFFRVQIPWRGVLFREPVILRVRREVYRPTDPADRYNDIAGGLNLMRYSDFLGHVAATGWRFDYLGINTFLQPYPPLRKLSDLIARTPVLRDYFAHNVYAVLKKA